MAYHVKNRKIRAIQLICFNHGNYDWIINILKNIANQLCFKQASLQGLITVSHNNVCESNSTELPFSTKIKRQSSISKCQCCFVNIAEKWENFLRIHGWQRCDEWLFHVVSGAGREAKMAPSAQKRRFLLSWTNMEDPCCWNINITSLHFTSLHDVHYGSIA